MFVLQKNNKSRSGPEYHVLAGTKYNVNKRVTERDKRDRELELSTDAEVVKSLKSSHQLKEALVRLDAAPTVTSLKVFKKILLLEFLALQDCELAHFQVCRGCGKMVDAGEDRVLGVISIKPNEIEKIIKYKQKWACKSCRIELALLSWGHKNDYHAKLMVGKSQEINDEVKDLMAGNYTFVQNVIRITPMFDDYKVITYIKTCLNDLKPTKSNEDHFKHSIINSFVRYHCQKEDLLLIRVCERCGHLWKNLRDLGYSSADTSEVCYILNNGRNWVCEKCYEYPSLKLLGFEEHNKTIGYCLELNGPDPVVEDNTFERSYVKNYVCMELYDKGAFSKQVVNELYGREILRSDGQFLRSTLSELQLMNTILDIFISSTNKSCKTCTYCRHIFDTTGNKIGFFWANRDLPLPFYVCPYHCVKTVLYWNMTGWKTIEKVRETQLKILEDADIVCLTETHLVEGMFGDHDEYFPDRIVVNVSAEKREQRGRGSGGVMFLIKKGIMCSQTNLDFSDKGVFQKIQFPNDTYIVGVIYWKPNPGETESLEDWIKELDNFLTINGSREVKFIIGGDFNGRIKDDDGYKENDLFTGSFLRSTRRSADKTWNKRGRELLKLMRKHKMVICNGRTNSDKAGTFTSRTVNGESVVDYVFISANLVPHVEDMSVRDVHSVSADFHRGLLLSLRQP